MSDLICELHNCNLNGSPKLGKSFDYRIRAVLPKLHEGYAGGGLNVVIKCSAQRHPFGRWEFALVEQICLPSCILHAGSEFDGNTGGDNHQFPMLVESVQVVDDKERTIKTFGAVCVGLHVFDKVQHLSVRDGLYFSGITRQFIFLPRLVRKDWKVNRVLKFDPLCAFGEVPYDMI